MSSGSWPRLLVHLRIRHLPALPRGHEGRDGEAFALAAPVEPLVNELLRKPGVVPGLLGVADDAIVVPVTLQLALEGGDDFGKRQAPRFLQPILQRRHCGTEFLGVGAAFHHPIVRIAPGFMPVEVEAQEGKLPAAFRLPPVEFNQRALLFGEFESELRQPNGQITQVGLRAPDFDGSGYDTFL